MNRRESLKLMGGAAMTGAVSTSATAAPPSEPSGLYFGMCLKHYKNEKLNRLQKVERIAKFGFKYLNDTGIPREATKAEIRDMKQAINDNGLVPVQCGEGAPDFGTFDPADGDKILDKAKYYFDNAAELGYKLTCPLPPRWSEEMPVEVSWGLSIEWTRKYAALLAERGMGATCEVEPERDFISCRFRDAIAWLEHVDAPNFYLNVDTGHFTLWKFKPKWLRKYGEMIVHSHLTDNDGAQHQSWALGTGKTDNVGYVQAMLEGGIVENARKRGIPPVTCLELYIPGHTGPDFDEVITTSIAWVKEHLPHVPLS